MATLIQIRRDTAANWASANPILAQGEMGYELNTGKLKFGDGVTAWTSLSYFEGGGSTVTGGSTEGVVSYSTAPTLRQDGSLLQEGDLYYNTSDDTLYAYNGGSWQPVGGGAAGASADAVRQSAVEPTTDAGGNPLAAGDVYYNTTDGVMYVHNGSAFEPVAKDATSVKNYATEPASGVEGDIYYNTTLDKLFVHNGVEWKELASEGTTNIVSYATEPTTREDGSPLQPGDIYYNTTTNETFVYDGTQFEVMGGASTEAESLRSQPVAPTTKTDGSPLTSGDVYYNTTDNTIYAHNGATWEPLDASASSFDTKAVDPVGGSEGDTYFNTTTNTLKVFDGSSWVDVNTDANTTNVAVTFNTTTGALNIADSDGNNRSTNLDGRYTTLTQVQNEINNQISSSVTFSDLSDVNVAPTNGHTVEWNGSQWISVPRFDGDYNSLTNVPAGISSINELSDVDTTTTPPLAGYILKWNGSKWVPGVDVAAGGIGLDADTLDGFDSSYFLDYNNLANLPAGVDVYVTSVAFNNGSGDLTIYNSDSTNVVTNLDGRYIQGTGTLAQVATTGDFNDLINQPTVPTSIFDLTDVSSGGVAGDVLQWNGSSWAAQTIATGDTYLTAGSIDSIGTITFTMNDSSTVSTDIAPYVTFAAVMKTGSTMTGPLTLNADPTTNLQAATKQYVDAAVAAVPPETVTSLSVATNILSYVDEAGATTNIDLSLYLDDSNLARIVSGSMDSAGIATFTRDDATTFTVDMSALISDIDTLPELTDVTITTPANGEALIYNGAGWVNQALPTGVTTLAALTDTNVGTPTDQHVLVYDGVNGKWVAQANAGSSITSSTIDPAGVITLTKSDTSTLTTDISHFVYAQTLNQHSDVDTATAPPADGQVLSWDATAVKWVPAALPSGVTSFAALSDTDVTSIPPVDLDTLSWDATNSVWIPSTRLSTVETQLTSEAVTRATADSALDARISTLEATDIVAINDLSDVDTTAAPAASEVLSWDATNSVWAPASIASISNPLAMNDLTDVVANPTVDGEVITWSAANNRWESAAPAAETTTSISLAANTLSYVDEAGATTNIDLSLYLDDTNLARITSGTLDAVSGIATFTRDDASTFTLDLSSLLDTDTDALVDLTDVTITTPASGEILSYDGAGWVNAAAPSSEDPRYIGVLNGAPSVRADGSALQYADLYFETSTEKLMWNEGSSWLPIDTNTNTLQDLLDTDFTTAPTDGQALTWDNANSKWVPSNAGANELTDLSDVVLPAGAAQGDVLTINSTGNYEFTTPAAASSLNDLTDVLLAAPRQTGDSLIWNGTQFRNGFSSIFTTTPASLNNDYNLVFKGDASTSNLNIDAATKVTYNPSTTELKVDGNLVLDASDSIDKLVDVDTSTAAPTDGQALVWDNASSKWVPGSAGGDSIYTANGTLTGPRFVDQNSNVLSFFNGPAFNVNSGDINLAGTANIVAESPIINLTTASLFYKTSAASTVGTKFPVTDPTPTDIGKVLTISSVTNTGTNDIAQLEWADAGASVADGTVNGQMLYWRTDLQRWEPGLYAGALQNHATDASATSDMTLQGGAVMLGSIYYNTTDDVLKVYDGGWNVVGGSSIPDGTIGGQSLTWNGTSWVAHTPQAGAFITGNDETVMSTYLASTDTLNGGTLMQGSTFYDISTDELKIYDGTNWNVVGGGSGVPDGNEALHQLMWNGTSWVSAPSLAVTFPIYADDSTADFSYTSVSGGFVGAGYIYYNNTDNELRVYDGTNWSAVGGGSGVPDGTTFGQLTWWNGSAWVNSTDMASGNFQFDGFTGTFITDSINSSVHTITPSGGTSGNVIMPFNKTMCAIANPLSGASTISVDTGTATAGIASSVSLLFTTTGSPSITWSPSMLWPEGTPPTINDGTHIVTFLTMDGGSTVYCNYLTNFA